MPFLYPHSYMPPILPASRKFPCDSMENTTQFTVEWKVAEMGSKKTQKKTPREGSTEGRGQTTSTNSVGEEGPEMARNEGQPTTWSRSCRSRGARTTTRVLERGRGQVGGGVLCPAKSEFQPQGLPRWEAGEVRPRARIRP